MLTLHHKTTTTLRIWTILSSKHCRQQISVSRMINTTMILRSFSRECTHCTSFHWSWSISTSIITTIGMCPGYTSAVSQNHTTGGKIVGSHSFIGNWRKCSTSLSRIASREGMKINMERLGHMYRTCCWTFQSIIPTRRSITWGKNKKQRRRRRKILRWLKISCSLWDWCCQSAVQCLVYHSGVRLSHQQDIRHRGLNQVRQRETQGQPLNLILRKRR